MNGKYKFHATISVEGHEVKDVVCELDLPKRCTDRVELRFSPSGDQSPTLGVAFKFAVRAEPRDEDDGLPFLLRADTVYRTGGGTTHWTPRLEEHSLVGEAQDLRLTYVRRTSPPYTTSFWVTPNVFLKPFYLRTVSYDGSAKVENPQCFGFTLEDGTELRFAHHYRYIDETKGETRSFAELVAESEANMDASEFEATVDLLDEFLLLTSFATRQRSICVGWNGEAPSGVAYFYRRGLSMPKD